MTGEYHDLNRSPFSSPARKGTRATSSVPSGNIDSPSRNTESYWADDTDFETGGHLDGLSDSPTPASSSKTRMESPMAIYGRPRLEDMQDGDTEEAATSLKSSLTAYTATKPQYDPPANPNPAAGFRSNLGLLSNSGQDQCRRCGLAVYFAEKVVAADHKWHKRCLLCAKCNKTLDSHLVEKGSLP